MAECDLLILGGGCAGLSLGMHLARDAGGLTRIRILEARSAYSNDRSWCFWRHGALFTDGLIRTQWQQLALQSAAQKVSVSCADTPYQFLAAEDFYRHACQQISASDHVQLQLGTQVLGEPTKHAAHWQVETNAGTITARAIIDTRPACAPAAGDAVLWQSFLGHEIRTNSPQFNPAIATLMHFSADTTLGATFTYLLPLSPDVALIETTVFGATPHSPEALVATQAEAVRQFCHDAQLEILRTEHGILPMGLTQPMQATRAHYTRVGVASGGARPSTGYAFMRIQRWAVQCAASLRAGGAPLAHAPDPWLTRFMDRLFLEVLRAQPQLAATLYLRMFGRVATPRLIRFLSDGATLIDRLAIIVSLPVGLFLGALFTPRFVRALLQGCR